MSYILDALKKLEKERRHGTVPDLLTVQDTMAREPKRRSLWPYVFLVALLLNAGLLALWLIPWQSKKPDVVAHSTAGQQLESKEAVSPSLDLAKTVSPGVKADEKRSEKDRTIQTKVDMQRKASGSPLPTVAKGGSHEVVPSVKKHPPVTSRVPSEPKPDNKSVAVIENKVYNLDELPSSVQQNLPAFTISVSLYSDDPASRMVKVNGQMMREGEYLTAGLKLEEITPNGIVFSYQKYRFLVRLK